MTIQSDRLEAGIYRLQLSGLVTFDDLYEVQTALLPQIADQDNFKWAVVVEIDHHTRLPLDVTKARLVFQRDRSVGTIIVGHSKMWLFIGKTIQQLFPKARIQYVRTLAEALVMARGWLRNKDV